MLQDLSANLESCTKSGCSCLGFLSAGPMQGKLKAAVHWTTEDGMQTQHLVGQELC